MYSIWVNLLHKIYPVYILNLNVDNMKHKHDSFFFHSLFTFCPSGSWKG